MTDSPRNPLISRPQVSEGSPLPSESGVFDETKANQFLDEMRETIEKLDRDNTVPGDLRILSRALKELRYAFKVFTPYRRMRKVTVFGSARMKPEHPSYQQAIEFGREMAQAGWYVVTGAGGGIMEAAHMGAGREMSMGLNIILPWEQEANKIISDDKKLVNLKYFFTRKLMFVKEVHAIAMFPGGYGTLDEFFETITLIQTGKRDLMPIVAIDGPHDSYYADLLEYMKKHLLKTHLISPEDLSLVKVTQDVREAFREVIRFYTVYNSMRYIKGKLYLRLHMAPPPEFLHTLNHEFKDIITEGRIECVPTHPYEADEPHLASLPRIAFHFDRRALSRLRQMIDLINDTLAAACVDQSDECIRCKAY
jgi:uncharacterized protein (TIGR00730 family)